MKSIYSMYISSRFGVNEEKSEGEGEEVDRDARGGRRREWGYLLQSLFPPPPSEGWEGQELKEPHQGVMERLPQYSEC